MATPMNGAVQGVATSTASSPVKKLPVCPGRAARPLAGAARPAPNSEHAGQVEPDSEQQPGHGRDEHRGLELESPAGALTRRRAPPAAPRRGQRTPPARRPYRRPPASAPAACRPLPASADRLHRQHREDARHQVEDQSAQESQPQKAPETHGRRSRRHGAGRGARAPHRSPARCGRGTDRTPDSWPSGRNALPGCSASVNPPCQHRQWLRGAVVDRAGRIGDEPARRPR